MPDKLDLINRDPFGINDHVKVAFEDVLAEPDSAHSVDCVWTMSSICFSFCRSCWYNFFTFFCGFCVAAQWGAIFGWITVQHVWAITPCFKVLELHCGCAKKLYGLCVHCFLDPFFEACSLIFTSFRRQQ